MNVLTLLPAGKLFDLVFTEAIAPALAEANASSLRVTVTLQPEPARIALSEAITKADLVLLDLTGRSAGAMYAAGLANAAQRKTLLLIQHLEDFPFDPSAHDIIVYAGDRPFLKSELIAHLSAKPSNTAANLARDKFLSAFGDILQKHHYIHHGDITLENPSTFVLLNQDMELALVQDLARRARELGLRLKLM